MISKEEIVNVLLGGFRRNPYFNGFEIKKHPAGDFEFLNESSDSVRSFSWRFLGKNNGYEIDQLSTKIYLKTLEGSLEPILTKHRFNSSLVTLRNSSNNNRELFLGICSTEINDSISNEKVSRIFEEYLTKEIIPFFKSRSTIEGLGEFVLQHDFSNIINIGIGGEYPLNVLKAIAIAKWCGNEARYQEYTTGLQSWIDEDRKDPNYAPKCDSYQGALNDLKTKLESRT